MEGTNSHRTRAIAVQNIKLCSSMRSRGPRFIVGGFCGSFRLDGGSDNKIFILFEDDIISTPMLRQNTQANCLCSPGDGSGDTLVALPGEFAPASSVATFASEQVLILKLLACGHRQSIDKP